MLAVEGDPEGRESIQALMADTGIQVDTSSSLEEALGRLEEDGTYQLVLLDWDGPELDGPQAAQALRRALAGDRKSVV